MAANVQATAAIGARRPRSMKLSKHDSRQRKVVGVAEISVFAQRLVHRCEDAEHGTPCTLVLQKDTSAMSTDVVWDRSHLQLGCTGCRPRAALVHVGCRSHVCSSGLGLLPSNHHLELLS
jgi:hypothetical protein